MSNEKKKFKHKKKEEIFNYNSFYQMIHVAQMNSHVPMVDVFKKDGYVIEMMIVVIIVMKHHVHLQHVNQIKNLHVQIIIV